VNLGITAAACSALCVEPWSNMKHSHQYIPHSHAL